MADKLNFYDLVGLLIPGGMVLGFFYWFCVGFIGLSLSLDAVGLGESILLIGIAYLAGHVVQALGNRGEKGAQEKQGGGLPSALLMRDEDEHYSAEFKQQFKSAAEKTFGLPYQVEEGAGEKAAQTRRRELFDLCYTLLVQEDAAKHVEIFNGTYSLIRGAISALWVGVAVSLLILLKEVGLFFGWLQGIIPGWSYDWAQLISGALGLILSFFAQRLLKERFERFGRRFADGVYRSFYVWFKRHEKEPQTQR
jgi:hypothetical protein